MGVKLGLPHEGRNTSRRCSWTGCRGRYGDPRWAKYKDEELNCIMNRDSVF